MVRMWFVPVLCSILVARPALAGKNESLLRAVQTGDTVRVAQLLEKGAAVDFEGWDKGRSVTPLAAAIERLDLAMARLLLARGATPTAANGVALVAAAGSAPSQLVTMLIEHGARFSSKDVATMMARRDFESARLVLKESSFCSEKSNHGLSFLSGTPNCEVVLWSALEASEFEMVKALLARGPDGSHAMQMAARAGRIELVDTLLALGADPNSTCMVSRRMTAEEMQSQGLSGATIGRSYHTNTVLASMCSDGYLEVARHLLDHGANPEGNPRFKETPLALAEARGDSAMIMLLKKHLMLRENRPPSPNR
jgi:ankyrin repeat protein